MQIVSSVIFNPNTQHLFLPILYKSFSSESNIENPLPQLICVIATKILLKAGSNVNLQNIDGFNSLHLSIYSKSLELCTLIIDHGVNINTRFNTGETALHLACNFE